MRSVFYDWLDDAVFLTTMTTNDLILAFLQEFPELTPERAGEIIAQWATERASHDESA